MLVLAPNGFAPPTHSTTPCADTNTAGDRRHCGWRAPDLAGSGEVVAEVAGEHQELLAAAVGVRLEAAARREGHQRRAPGHLRRPHKSSCVRSDDSGRQYAAEQQMLPMHGLCWELCAPKLRASLALLDAAGSEDRHDLFKRSLHLRTSHVIGAAASRLKFSRPWCHHGDELKPNCDMLGRHLIAVAFQHAALDAGHRAGHRRHRGPADDRRQPEVRVQLHAGPAQRACASLRHAWGYNFAHNICSSGKGTWAGQR